MFRSFALCATVLMAGVASAQQLPVEYFVKSGDYLDVSLSPSGKYLAARVRVDETIAFVVVDRATNEVIGGTRPQRNSVIHSVDWVSDERLVFAYAQKRAELDTPVSTGELFAIDYDGSGLEMLAGVRASDARTGSRLSNRKSSNSSFYLVSPLPEDDRHILVIEYPWSKHGTMWHDDRVKVPVVSRLDVRTGREKRVAVLPYSNAFPYTTRDGRLVFLTYELEDGTWASAYRPSEDAEWQPLDKVFDQVTDEFLVNGVSADGKAAYLSGPYGEQRYTTVFRLDFESQTLEPLFTDLDADLRGVMTDYETGRIAAAMTMRDKPRYHYPAEDSPMKSAHRMLAKAFAGRTVQIVSATRDLNELVVRVSSDVNPGEYYIFDLEKKKADFFWANKSWIDPRLLRPVITDTVTTDDGLTLPVLLTMPESDAPAPLVVLPHGGPHGVADLWGFDGEAQLLASRGYAVLQVNFRGSGGYGDEFELAGYKQWGGKMIDDIAAATRWATDRDDIDGSRVCAYGASYGAYASYMLAAREPELLNCVAGYVGVYDLNMMFTEGDIPESWGGLGYLERVLGTDKAVLSEFSPVNHVPSIKANALLVHGTADRRAPIEHAEAMRRAFDAAGKPVEWIEIKQSGHGAYSERSRTQLYGGLLPFLEANLK